MTVKPEVWLVCPFSRPECLDNVLANFHRQRYPADKLRLVLAANGRAAGTLPHWSGSHVMTVESDTGLAQPMNAGLRTVREYAAPGAWFCKFDDDDYYGPEYIADHIGAGLSRGADIVGKQRIWVRPKRGGMWLFFGPADQWDEAPGFGVHGATITARVEGAPDFPIVSDWGEDTGWIEASRAKGARIWLTGEAGFAYLRGGPNAGNGSANHNHAFDVEDDEILGLGVPVYDCGPWNTSTINGVKMTAPRTLIPPVRLQIEKTLGARRAIRKLPPELADAYHTGGPLELLRRFTPEGQPALE